MTGLPTIRLMLALFDLHGQEFLNDTHFLALYTVAMLHAVLLFHCGLKITDADNPRATCSNLASSQYCPMS